MFNNVKNQADYDALKWEDKLQYNGMNPGSQYAKNELKRTEQALYTNPTPEAQNWYSQQKYVAGGGTADNAILGSFDKSAYRWQQKPWVRDMMKSFGISDDRIGYSGGKVTLDGRDFMTPDVVANGKSYASNEAIQDAFRSYNNTNDIVAARSYINSKNPNINVGWDENLGQVKVGSVLLTPDYIQDGVAYVSRAKVDEALAKEVSASGLYNRRDILNQSDARWGDRIDRLYDRVENPDPFTWSAEKDAQYQDFKREWERQSQAQYDDTIAKMNSQSGGAPSLGAMAAAWNMLEDSHKQLDAYKQQFRQQAYQEYIDQRNYDMAQLEAAMGLRKDEFDRSYGVLGDTVNDAYYRQDWQNEFIDKELAREQAKQTLAMNDQTMQQSADLHPYKVAEAEQSLKIGNAELETLLYNLEYNKRLEPYELEQLALASETGRVQLSREQLNLLKEQLALSGMTFNSGGSSGGGGRSGSGSASGTDDTGIVDWEADYNVPVDDESRVQLKSGTVYTSSSQRDKAAEAENNAYLTPDGILAEAKQMIGDTVQSEADVEKVFRYVMSLDGLDDATKAKIIGALRHGYGISDDVVTRVLGNIGIKE